ncbi:MAG: hypothetical protein JJT90_19025, partial [Ectothiorhodospiraceae bacterium]|nr:hypothetical protein [Ectothiorhodospiraceae bacterium]
PWASEGIVDTRARARGPGGMAAAREQFALVVKSRDAESVRDALAAFVASPPSSAEVLAEVVPTQAKEKYDRYLPPALLNADYAARALDLPGALRVATGLLPAFETVIPYTQTRLE